MKFSTGFFLLTFVIILCSCPSPPEPTLQMIGYKYFVLLPRDYDQQQTCPLILFLHGAGCGTTNLDVVKYFGLGDYADSTADFPFIVVAPQTPDDWYPSFLTTILDTVISSYRVDTQRIYITGFSMGGAGTYTTALYAPDRFAAIVPISGWGSTSRACEIAHIPAWIFHNEGDPTISAQNSHAMVDSLQQCGATDLRYTFYPDSTHNAWTSTYHNPELYSWLLSHSKIK